MRHWLAVLLLALAGCATASSEDEKTAAIQAYVACMRAAANQLDDGISDAASIGLAVRGQCASAELRELQAWTAGMTYAGRESFRIKADAKRLQDATAVVLQERQKRRR